MRYERERKKGREKEDILTLFRLGPYSARKKRAGFHRRHFRRAVILLVIHRREIPWTSKNLLRTITGALQPNDFALNENNCGGITMKHHYYYLEESNIN